MEIVLGYNLPIYLFTMQNMFHEDPMDIGHSRYKLIYVSVLLSVASSGVHSSNIESCEY